MSLRIIKEGLLDTIQDTGRYGRQHEGINPGGAMDRFSAQLANALLGKNLSDPVIEMHFPAAQLLFEAPAVIAICGGDFSPAINKKPVPMHHPIMVNENALLQFERMQSGARVYVALLQPLALERWEGSYSTHLKAGAGGFQGRALRRYDAIGYPSHHQLAKIIGEQDFMVLPWKSGETVEDTRRIECIIGSEWSLLDADARESFIHQWFQVALESDRMGYRLKGPAIKLKEHEPLISSGVTFGTVQLLPDGGLIILMADHQTTGGYPRLAHVITAHLPLLAQKKPGDAFHFELTDLATAEGKLVKQQNYLEEIGIACKFRMESFLDAT